MRKPGHNHDTGQDGFHIRGGYENGAASSYNGDYLVELSGKRVVIVVIQYRLGVFGFLPGKAVKEGGDLNVGLCE